MVRRTSHHSYERIDHLIPRIRIVAADLLDQHSLTTVIRDVQPDEVYNLAAQSFVPTSFTQPVLTGEFTALGVTRILEAVRLACPDARFYQASSSEMFGKVTETPQRESTPFYPRSPVRRREALRPLDHGELPRVLRPLRGQRHPLQPRVAAPGHRIRHPQGHRRGGPDQAWPRDRTAPRQPRRRSATGATPATTSTPCGACCRQPEPRGLRHRHRRDALGARTWCGWPSPTSGSTGSSTSRVDPQFYRPAEVDVLLADATKARSRLGWQPQVPFDQLVAMMVDADLERLRGR